MKTKVTLGDFTLILKESGEFSLSSTDFVEMFVELYKKYSFVNDLIITVDGMTDGPVTITFDGMTGTISKEENF